ncbi:MAG: transposase [Pseudomonadota bacterium]|nr:transposase [Pseudomonadota bacterium]
MKKPTLQHGGSLAINRRKVIRPLDTKKPLHIVLKSDKAKGKLSLLNHQGYIGACLKKLSTKFRISIYEKAIVGNHLHLLIRGKTRKELQNFFRTIAALIARHVTKARRGKPFGRFWTYLLFSRLLTSWKKEFDKVKAYIVKNTLEALGMIRYQRGYIVLREEH